MREDAAGVNNHFKNKVKETSVFKTEAKMMSPALVRHHSRPATGSKLLLAEHQTRCSKVQDRHRFRWNGEATHETALGLSSLKRLSKGKLK